MLLQEKQGLLNTIDAACLFYNHYIPSNFQLLIYQLLTESYITFSQGS